jgi:sugar phosphate permease
MTSSLYSMPRDMPRERTLKPVALATIACSKLIFEPSAKLVTIAGFCFHFSAKPFCVVGLPGLAVALAALALREPERSGAEDVDEQHRQQHQAQPFSWRLYGSLFWNRSYLYNALAMAMFTFALGGLQLFAAKYFANLPGMDLKTSNNYLGPVLCVSGLIGMLLGSWLAERLKKRWRRSSADSVIAAGSVIS